LPIEQATEVLEGQLNANAHDTISFFGIPVERGLAIIAGPGLCIALLLFSHFTLANSHR